VSQRARRVTRPASARPRRRWHGLLLCKLNPSRGVSNTIFCRCSDAPTALGQRCDLAHRKRHGLIVHCRS
jgi:hypothetical protein